jgi:hypothetical protein
MLRSSQAVLKVRRLYKRGQTRYNRISSKRVIGRYRVVEYISSIESLKSLGSIYIEALRIYNRKIVAIATILTIVLTIIASSTASSSAA